ncbi:ABC transporter ATP-binding protein [Gorillibacterium massiliense]|uniref:ABC transporter ATP-binding protein n=1 Tax=Gorillibacterium massiliense TaxID=1280390 RepID=UPI0004B75BC3|nr:ABC transporter ATP-binding protein [Gorillibacterium massiliense]
MDKPVLEVDGLVKRYRSFSLKHVSFKLNRGDIAGFIGANGAGKTTTIKSILNIINYQEGKILFNGEELTAGREDLKIRIGYVGENNQFYESVEIKTISNFVKSVYKQYWDDKQFERLTREVFEIDLSKKMRELSKGMRTKFSLALALSHNPELLILDEPTSGLDPIVRDELLDILYRLSRERGTTLFFSSHITDDIEKIANSIIYIDSGAIICDTTKEEISRRFKKVAPDQITDANLQSLFQNKGFHTKGTIIVDTDSLGDDLSKYSELNFKHLVLDEVLLYLKHANAQPNVRC